jgi:hypothetical protein
MRYLLRHSERDIGRFSGEAMDCALAFAQRADISDLFWGQENKHLIPKKSIWMRALQTPFSLVHNVSRDASTVNRAKGSFVIVRNQRPYPFAARCTANYTESCVI